MNNLESLVGRMWTTKQGSTAIITAVEHKRGTGNRGDEVVYGTTSMVSVSVNGRVAKVPMFALDGVMLPDTILENDIQHSIDHLEKVSHENPTLVSGQAK